MNNMETYLTDRFGAKKRVRAHDPVWDIANKRRLRFRCVLEDGKIAVDDNNGNYLRASFTPDQLQAY